MLFILLIFLNWQWLTETVCENPKLLNLKEISGGASNKNYLFEDEGNDYFIRVAPKTGPLVGADIAIEYEVLQQLQGFACTPELIYFNPDKRVLVTEFMDLDDEPVDLSDKETRLSIFSLLHQIDALNLHISRTYTPYKSIVDLIDKLDGSVAPEFMEALPLLEKMDQELSTLPQDHLCHRDLHHDNILRCKGCFVLIDWEYAVMSHPFCTLASMATVERWDDAMMRECLNDYMDSPTEVDFHYLYLYRIMADSYWYVWTRLQSRLSPMEGYDYATWETIFLDAALSRILSSQECSKRLFD